MQVVNTTTRAHVGDPAQTPASAGDPVTENCRTSDEDNSDLTIQVAGLLSKKERRKQRKQQIQSDIPEYTTPEDAAPTQAPAQADHSDSEDDESTDGSAQLSRKEKKRLKKQREKVNKQQELASIALTSSHQNAKPKSKPPNNPPKATTASTRPTSIPPTLSSSADSMAGTYYPLLICSLGNPGALYANTLHSAGHRILETIRERGVYHKFERGMGGKVATANNGKMQLHFLKGFQKVGEREPIPGEDDFTLWQSTKLMNISGPAVNTAWREFSAKQRGRGLEGRLVIVHDELEADLGKISIKRGTASAKGHNGLKSVQASLGKNEWWRVGVGIGRPASREQADVSRYVLGKMTYTQEKALDNASFDVLGALRRIAEGTA